jgi:hypothetical protein
MPYTDQKVSTKWSDIYALNFEYSATDQIISVIEWSVDRFFVIGMCLTPATDT